MSKYEIVYESAVKVINESKGMLVQVQESKTTPVINITQMYPTDDGDWNFCSPRVSGAVSFRASLTSKQCDWLIAELVKAKALVVKAEQAAVKAATPKTAAKTTAPKAKRQAVQEDDVTIELTNVRTAPRRTVK